MTIRGVSWQESPALYRKASMQYAGSALPAGQKASGGHLTGLTSGLCPREEVTQHQQTGRGLRKVTSAKGGDASASEEK